MNKLKLVLLLAFIWKIHVYSGDYGHLTYTTKEAPQISHYGRWLHFKDDNGDEITISGSSTIVIRRTEE